MDRMKSFVLRLWHKFRRKREFKDRNILIGHPVYETFPANIIRNQKYSILTFLPMVFWQQLKFFFNLYFLVLALSQFYPDFKVGDYYMYWVPLGVVWTISFVREAVDDFYRYKHDKKLNNEQYRRLERESGTSELVPSSELQVGDLIKVKEGQRVPADLVLLRTSGKTGSCFVRTDQLDGETDWKLRLAIQATQKLENDARIFDLEANLYAERPQENIHSFIGTFNTLDGEHEESLGVDNTLWANTVVASGCALGIVVYTGQETRALMNHSAPRSKVGLLDLEVDLLAKILFLALVCLSFMIICLKGFGGRWYIYMFRFMTVLSYIIPISLRVNLDLGKTFYAWTIHRDDEMPGTVVRNSSISEDLGRISYLFSDKTGTLTQNIMVLKKLHLGTNYYGKETFDMVTSVLKGYFSSEDHSGNPINKTINNAYLGKIRKTEYSRIFDAVHALALCHNVTPVYKCSKNNYSLSNVSLQTMETSFNSMVDIDQTNDSTEKICEYQASSPDEVALVKWTEEVGLSLIKRDLNSMQLMAPNGKVISYTILQLFPFTSESKKMGIIVKDDSSGEIIFYMKGADVVMSGIVQYNDWLQEECCNMAREGLRTLVVAKKKLSVQQYIDFEARYNAARMSVSDRTSQVTAVVKSLEREMELLCLTGVEDKLQENVRQTLELLRNAYIKVWMLTGDKLETAKCIAQSSKLVSKTQRLHVFQTVRTETEAFLELESFRKKEDCGLVISGDSLEVCLQYYKKQFLKLACSAPAVVCCRCSPTQKSDVVKLIQKHTGKRTAAVGDGGNDVAMIQTADIGVGIEGLEGKQASLAADFSISQFSHLGRLLLVHGRRSYIRSAALSHFVIHRGLIISVLQLIFSIVFYFSSIILYQGFIMVGYSTVYTMLPVLSLLLDKDMPSKTALTYPELYKELCKGRLVTLKTFFIWVWISIYQGAIIMYGALILFDNEFIHIVGISFTALILTELIMIALTIITWHPLMIFAELLSLNAYLVSLFVLKDTFDPEFIKSLNFAWKVTVITIISCVPLYILKFLKKKFSPSTWVKLT